MAPLPNLYERQLPSKHQKLAEVDALGSVTLWTHFYNCIDFTKGTAFDVHDVTSTAEEDLVAAAYKIYASEAEKKDAILENEFFLRLLNRCVTCTYDMIQGMDSWLQEETGTSAFQTPALLHILVAVTIKHYNYEVLVALTKFALPPSSIFTVCPSPTISYLEPGLSRTGWDALRRAGWITASQRPLKPTEESQLPSTGTVGGNIRSCVRDLPSSTLRSYFSHVPRTLYTGIPPYPKWPGDLVLVKDAASRTGPEGVKVLQLLVEIGGMDVNDAETWWKPGDCDPRDWNPLCQDGSECTETALHIAVDSENVEAVEYLLTHGARMVVDRHGRDQKARCHMRGFRKVMEVFEKYQQ
ncbi:hypothetical protein BGZ61DRAFT_539030 [Ilyonectria robusta]|uniref:uncharacterized protein n=1 Tax=Ilyonectria robusta TaxID=1079257 RepID=UPI001E8DCCCA|nr:uncharacterized protein BGZ61DRAFT_539030 [Ilyonectria robusta]KAH8663719.1 hypothetical protein BGZ61DRAFT_539030 [Ilyonectria robusta]